MYTSVADFNGDGNLDVCVIGPDDRDGSNCLSAFILGNGKGKFERRVWTGNTLNDERGIAAIGDFNGDGKLDLAVPDVRCGGYFSWERRRHVPKACCLSNCKRCGELP